MCCSPAVSFFTVKTVTRMLWALQNSWVYRAPQLQSATVVIAVAKARMSGFEYNIFPQLGKVQKIKLRRTDIITEYTQHLWLRLLSLILCFYSHLVNCGRFKICSKARECTKMYYIQRKNSILF